MCFREVKAPNHWQVELNYCKMWFKDTQWNTHPPDQKTRDSSYELCKHRKWWRDIQRCSNGRNWFTISLSLFLNSTKENVSLSFLSVRCLKKWLSEGNSDLICKASFTESALLDETQLPYNVHVCVYQFHPPSVLKPCHSSECDVEPMFVCVHVQIF